MNTAQRQLVTIVSESVVEHRLVADIKRCGAKGYSLGHVTGEGLTGNHSLDLNGPSIRLETVVSEDVAQAIMTLLAEQYFDRYATVAWTTPVNVLRPNRY